MLQRIEKLLLELAVFAVLALGLLITTSVVLRAVFNSGIPDTIVMVRELMVAAIVLPLTAASSARAHIVVEFLTNQFPARIQGWFIVFGTGFGVLALTPLIYAGWNETVHAMQSGGFYFGQLELPKWPGQLVFLIGMSFCWLRLLLLVVSDVKCMRAGLPIADTQASAPMQDTEARSEH